MTEKAPRSPRPFNGPVETGLRMLFVLDAVSPRAHDIQRLVYYDYLLTHAGDVSGDQPHIHPAIPYRAGEILVRRELISRGLDLMSSKELIVKQLDGAGVAYVASKLCRAFLDYLTTEHAAALRTSAAWLAATFADLTDTELASYITENLSRWGAEFKFDALLRGGRE